MTTKHLTQLATSNPAAVAVFADLCQRSRYRREFNIRHLFKRLRKINALLDKDAIVAVFQRMQDLGLGALVHGRGMKPDRFVWKYNSKDVASAAAGTIAIESIHPYAPYKESVKKKYISVPPKKRPELTTNAPDSLNNSGGPLASLPPTINASGIAAALPIEPMAASANATGSVRSIEVLLFKNGLAERKIVPPDKVALVHQFIRLICGGVGATHA